MHPLGHYRKVSTCLKGPKYFVTHFFPFYFFFHNTIVVLSEILSQDILRKIFQSIQLVTDFSRAEGSGHTEAAVCERKIRTQTLVIKKQKPLQIMDFLNAK